MYLYTVAANVTLTDVVYIFYTILSQYTIPLLFVALIFYASAVR